jgi:hypothetical protein
MTAISPQPEAVPQAQAGVFGGRAPILLAFPERAPQQRLTVLLRIIFAIPHLVALWALGIVAEIVLLIGWFGALFTGRLPQFAEDYLSGYLQWQARVNAYCLLLTDVYPPFTFGDSDYPVRVAVPRPGPLNRLAVFFRIILGFPAGVVTALLVWGGQTIVLFITWLIVLVTGTMPASLHEAYVAVLRYSIRYTGYMTLLTGEYPSALFGDQPAPGTAPGGGSVGYPAADDSGLAAQQQTSFPAEPGGYPVQAPGGPVAAGGPPAEPVIQPGGFQAQPGSSPTQPGSSTTQPGGYPGEPGGFQSEPGGFSAQPGSFSARPGGFSAQPGGFPAPASQPGETRPFAPATTFPQWQLVLSDGAKGLIRLFLALGVVLIIVYVVVLTVVLNTAVNSTVIRRDAINQVQASYTKLNGTLSSFQAKSFACHGDLQCVTTLDRQASRAFDTFGTSVRSTAMPNAASTSAANQLAAASLQAGRLLQRLGKATTAAQYEAIVNSSNVQRILAQVDLDYQHLGTELNAS